MTELFFESLILRITNMVIIYIISLLEAGINLHKRIWEGEDRIKRMSWVTHMIIKSSCLLVLINTIFGNFVDCRKTESHDLSSTKFDMALLYLGYAVLQLNFLVLETWWFWRLTYSTFFWVVYKLVGEFFMPEFKFANLFIVCYNLTFCTNLCKNLFKDWNLEDIKRFLIFHEEEATRKVDKQQNKIRKTLHQTQVN